MRVMCKFRCDTVTKHQYGETVKMVAVWDKETLEHQSFAEATPSGTLEFFVTNKAVHGFYQPGKCYYLSIIPEDETPLNTDQIR